VQCVLKFCHLLILSASQQNDPISEDDFMAKWNTAVGDTFASHTSLELLTVRNSVLLCLLF